MMYALAALLPAALARLEASASVLPSLDLEASQMADSAKCDAAKPPRKSDCAQAERLEDGSCPGTVEVEVTHGGSLLEVGSTPSPATCPWAGLADAHGAWSTGDAGHL